MKKCILTILLFSLSSFLLRANDKPFYGSLGPYASWAYPNTARYGMKIVVLGRFDQYGTKEYKLWREEGTVRDAVRYPGYHLFVFSGFTDPGFRAQFRWLELGAGCSPFWMKDYRVGIRGRGFDNLREIAVRFRFSAAYVFALWKSEKDFLNLRFDYSVPMPRRVKRWDVSFFYTYALGLPEKNKEDYSQNQFGVQVYYKPKFWYRY